MKEAKEYIRKHLKACCAEVLDAHQGMPYVTHRNEICRLVVKEENGMRNLASIRLAEMLITEMAMQKCIGMK